MAAVSPAGAAGAVTAAAPVKPINLQFVFGIAALWLGLTALIELGFEDIAAMLALLTLGSFALIQGPSILAQINKAV